MFVVLISFAFMFSFLELVSMCLRSIGNDILQRLLIFCFVYRLEILSIVCLSLYDQFGSVSSDPAVPMLSYCKSCVEIMFLLLPNSIVVHHSYPIIFSISWFLFPTLAYRSPITIVMSSLSYLLCPIVVGRSFLLALVPPLL